MTLKRWKITIEYDGSAYAGWQRQEDGVPSVQQAIEGAITAFCQQEITIHAAGRTDAGVHAGSYGGGTAHDGQVAHFDLDYGTRPLTGFDLAKALSAHLRPQNIAILQAEEVPKDFHARYNATNKLYNYYILNRPAPPALDAGRAWHVKRPLDADAMHMAAQRLVGHHDFTTFRDSQCQAKSPKKTLDRLEVTRDGDMIKIAAEARSFLHHQIRNFAGTLALVGEGKWSLDDISNALEARDRAKGGPTAPPHGLYLVRVDY